MITPVYVLSSKEAWLPVAVDESLAQLGYSWNNGWVKDGQLRDSLNLPGGMKPAHFQHLEPSGYHRVVEAGALFWHQFWTWWPYNPKKYPPTKRGIGAHEGDWELVQTGCVDAEGNRPVLMTCSQHDGGERREHWRVELEDGRPRVYIARDSHASYFAPVRDVTDTADGKGPVLSLKWLDFGPWTSWPSKWGNSDNSPGPLTTRRAWKAPHAWHSQARS